MAVAKKISAYGKEVTNDWAVKNCFVIIHSGDTTIKDKPNVGRPSYYIDNILKATLKQNIYRLKRRITESFKTSKSIICRHLRKLKNLQINSLGTSHSQ